MQDIRNLDLPTSLMSSLEQRPDAPLTRLCPTCGEIPALPVKTRSGVRYLRRACPCEEKAREDKEKAEQLQVWMDWQRTRTFSWLGDRWSDADLRAKTFGTFNAAKQPTAYDTCRIFAGSPVGALVLHGTFGTGKTHLLAAICIETLEKRRISSLFTTAPALFAAINAKIQEHESYSQIIDHVIKTPLLVIDDVDKAKHTEFREEVYFEIIDRRVKAGKPLALSTNRLSELANFVGGAVCSRLKVGQIDEEMIGQDYREEM